MQQKPKSKPKKPARALPTEVGTSFQPWWDTTGSVAAHAVGVPGTNATNHPTGARVGASTPTSNARTGHATIYKGPHYTITQRQDGRFVLFEPGQEPEVLPESMTRAELERIYIDERIVFSQHRRSYG